MSANNNDNSNENDINNENSNKKNKISDYDKKLNYGSLSVFH